MTAQTARRALALALPWLALGGALAAQPAGPRPSAAMIFRWLDKNGDGVLTQAEYVANSRFADKEKARKIFRAADTDGDGKIDQRRYVEHRRVTDKAKEIFAKLDADGNGKMTRAELAARLDALFATLDKDGDGHVTIPEFLRTRADWAEMKGESVDSLLKRLEEKPHANSHRRRPDHSQHRHEAGTGEKAH